MIPDGRRGRKAEREWRALEIILTYPNDHSSGTSTKKRGCPPWEWLERRARSRVGPFRKEERGADWEGEIKSKRQPLMGGGVAQRNCLGRGGRKTIDRRGGGGGTDRWEVWGKNVQPPCLVAFILEEKAGEARPFI